MANISIDAEAQLAGQLLDLLGREQAVLMGSEIEAMEQVLEQKSQLIQQLSMASHQRYQVLAAMAFEPNETGMEQWLQQRKNAADTRAWAEFQDLLAHSKEMNRVNGLLINKHFSRNQQLLGVLQGTRKTGQFYGPDGQASSGSALRGGIMA